MSHKKSRSGKCAREAGAFAGVESGGALRGQRGSEDGRSKEGVGAAIACVSSEWIRLQPVSARGEVSLGGRGRLKTRARGGRAAAEKERTGTRIAGRPAYVSDRKQLRGRGEDTREGRECSSWEREEDGNAAS